MDGIEHLDLGMRVDMRHEPKPVVDTDLVSYEEAVEEIAEEIWNRETRFHGVEKVNVAVFEKHPIPDRVDLGDERWVRVAIHPHHGPRTPREKRKVILVFERQK